MIGGMGVLVVTTVSAGTAGNLSLGTVTAQSGSVVLGAAGGTLSATAYKGSDVIDASLAIFGDSSSAGGGGDIGAGFLDRLFGLCQLVVQTRVVAVLCALAQLHDLRSECSALFCRTLHGVDVGARNRSACLVCEVTCRRSAE